METTKKRLSKILSSGGFISFFVGFVFYLLIILPILINDHGIFAVNGDYIHQVIPFTYHIRDSIYSGNLCWDWSNGLGGQFLSSYAYYNLFSPFSLIYLIIPRSWIVYAIPYVTALKYGTGCMLAFFYVRRFTREQSYAVIAGILYMFSSFTAYNTVFHFIDVIALFPLLLIALEELCVNKRRCVFGLMVALMALVNYYFFFGQAVFCVIYYFVRGRDKGFGLSGRQFLSVLAESLLGVMLTAAVLLPVGLELLSNGKATAVMSLSEMPVYSGYTYPKIIQSIFMLPDPYYFASLFPETQIVYPFGTMAASLAMYIPLFSFAGVISFVLAKKKDWASLLIIICVVMMFVPVLNQLFSGLNSAYYARWLYMPMLICCMASVRAVEEELDFRAGIITCTAAVLFFIGYQIFADPSQAIVRYSSKPTYSTAQNILHFAVTIVSLVILIVAVKSKRDKDFPKKLFIFTLMCCYMVFGVMTQYIYSTGPNADETLASLNRAEITEPFDKEERVIFAGNTGNFNHLWNGCALSQFNSNNDAGYVEFLNATGLVRPTNVLNQVGVTFPALCDLCSARFLLSLDERDTFPEQWEEVGTLGEYYVYENSNYLPMGFTYDSVISAEDVAAVEDIFERQRLYLRALVVDDPEEFSDILPLSEKGAAEPVSEEEYRQLIETRRESAADFCQKTTRGLDAEITLEKENIVFFSASYNGGWSAFVDGEPAELYKVNSGMIGVRVPQGTHSVSLRYTVRGFKAGCAVSAAAAALFAVYAFLTRKKKA